jgi:hypothetical protein
VPADIVILRAESGLPCPADVILFETSEDFVAESYLNIMDKPHQNALQFNRLGRELPPEAMYKDGGFGRGEETKGLGGF